MVNLKMIRAGLSGMQKAIKVCAPELKAAGLPTARSKGAISRMFQTKLAQGQVFNKDGSFTRFGMEQLELARGFYGIPANATWEQAIKKFIDLREGGLKTIQEMFNVTKEEAIELSKMQIKRNPVLY